MFWKKVECDRCGRKNRESRAVYVRGSHFCTAECRDGWAKDNPPPIARGTAESLRNEIAIVIEAACADYRRFLGLVPRPMGGLGDAVAALSGPIGRIQRVHRAEEQREALMHFHTHVLRCAPLLRGLGYEVEAYLIDSTDIMRSVRDSLTLDQARRRLDPIAQALEHVRQQLQGLM